MRLRYKILMLGVLCGVSALAIFFARCEYERRDLLSDLCTNTVLVESISPNQRFKAIAFARDCGAVGFPHTIVAVVPKDQGISKHEAIDERLAVTAWEGHCEINLLWRNDETLLVEERAGGEKESSAPGWARVKASVDRNGALSGNSPMSLSESWE